jgi:hypothetical protein
MPTAFSASIRKIKESAEILGADLGFFFGFGTLSENISY